MGFRVARAPSSGPRPLSCSAAELAADVGGSSSKSEGSGNFGGEKALAQRFVESSPKKCDPLNSVDEIASRDQPSALIEVCESTEAPNTAANEPLNIHYA